MNEPRPHTEAELIELLRSSDVLHSFFLPQMRIKQDAVPGLTIPVWFDSDRAGKFELVCAELCGWGHYKMRGRLYVHKDKEDFLRWLQHAQAEQQRTSPTVDPSARTSPAPPVRVRNWVGMRMATLMLGVPRLGRRRRTPPVLA